MLKRNLKGTDNIETVTEEEKLDRLLDFLKRL